MGNLYLLLLIPLIRAILSHFFVLTFVGTVPLYLTKYLMRFSTVITSLTNKKMACNFLCFLAVIWIDNIVLQHCVFKNKNGLWTWKLFLSFVESKEKCPVQWVKHAEYRLDMYMCDCVYTHVCIAIYIWICICVCMWQVGFSVWYFDTKN